MAGEIRNEDVLRALSDTIETLQTVQKNAEETYIRSEEISSLAPRRPVPEGETES